MTRRLFNILSALSLLLCIFVVGVWVYSFFWTEWFEERNGRSSFTLEPNWICCRAEADKGTLPVPDPRPDRDPRPVRDPQPVPDPQPVQPAPDLL